MPTERSRPSFMRAMSQLRNLGAWTWHWIRAGELGALDRNKAFDIAYVQHLLRRIKPKLEAAGLSRELEQIESLDRASQNLMSNIDGAELPSPLAAQRVVVVIESVQVSLLHTLQSKLGTDNNTPLHNARTDANDLAITAINECDIARSTDIETITWESLERQIAELEHQVAISHRRLAAAETQSGIEASQGTSAT